jgi:hypothetical protein
MDKISVQILSGGNLILAFLAPALDFALKIKHLLELDPDVKVNVTNLSGAAITADDATIQAIAAWKKRHGIPDAPVSTAPPAGPFST